MIISAQTTQHSQIDLSRTMQRIAALVKSTVAGVILVSVVRMIGLSTILDLLAKTGRVAAALTHVKLDGLVALPEISFSQPDPFLVLVVVGLIAMALMMGVAVFSTRLFESKM